MNIKGISASTLFCAMTITATGCADTSDGFEDDFSFRGGQGEFWEVGAQFDANNDVEIREGDDDDPTTIGDILWDIDTAGVTRDNRDETTDTLVNDGNMIRDFDLVAGSALGVRCTGVEAGGQRYQLVDTDGSVVLTTWKRRVFMGDVGQADLTNDNVAFSLKNNHIFLGHWSNGVVVATTDADLNQANPMRTMFIGSLVAGECGSAGLPEE